MLGVIMGTADANLTSAVSDLTDYFTSNLPVVVGAIIAVGAVLWFLKIIFKSLGVKKAGGSAT